MAYSRHIDKRHKESEMARHFGAQHMRNGYAAMGGSLKRPIYAGVTKKRTVAEAIAAARRQAANEAKRKK